jgi:ABC-type phosphate transport system substrate-binding protein
MRTSLARRLVPAGIISAAAVAALAVPGAASAALGTQCSGVNITGQGSSLQKLAQQTVWTSEFNASSKNKAACAGAKGQGNLGKPVVNYTSTGSGAGLESWGVNKHVANFEATNAFIGTDEPPNSTQISEIEAEEPTLIGGEVESIPVAQESVAVVVNLPTGCTATSKKDKGRLELNNATLEGIFRGTVKTWGEVNADGDTLTGAGCTTAPIVPIVRKDQSGTTHIFKKYLDQINPATFLTESPKEQNKTWTEVSEGPESTTWPKAAGVKKPESTGGGAELTTVASTPGSIGYANIAEARANGAYTPAPGTGGPGTARFWAPVQSDGVATTGKLKYADPSSNKDASALGEANCKDTVYTNGEVAFPPADVFDPWNEVTTATTAKKYTLCGLTYDLAFKGFSAFAGTTEPEATTVNNYLSFVVNAKGGGGQKLIAEHDYLALPKGNVLKEAQEGAAEIGF